MKESIGGTMLFWIVLIFLSIFITFMASVIKYAFTYKIKNNLINYIEKNEGINNKEEIEVQLANNGYPANGNYMICKHLVGNDSDTKRVFWYVKVHATFQMPIINSTFDIPIQGETVYIQTGVINDSNHWKATPTGACICRGISDCKR